MKLMKVRTRAQKGFFAINAADAGKHGLLADARAVEDGDARLLGGDDGNCLVCGRGMADHRMFRVADVRVTAHPMWVLIYEDDGGEIGALKEYIPYETYAERYEVRGVEVR